MLDEMIEKPRIERNTKYKVLVNYLKVILTGSSVYIDKEKIELILKVLEEVE